MLSLMKIYNNDCQLLLNSKIEKKHLDVKL